MGRILAIDYGRKKCGLAVTDPMQLIAQALETVPTHQLFDWLASYLAREEVTDLVMGESTDHEGRANPIQAEILGFERKFARQYPDIRLHRQDEFDSSHRARRSLLAMGTKKKDRRDKTRVDRVAAALILQDFLEGR
ncbi:Holliday junction resolvase RuvX [Lewinella sp. IMCC34183]|uniref:Holliday junction resolvase RuvX n=1 Tax=Lewinella sp. IMCC34183 TaxID=2248762 RepID=UPI000E2281FA|nr:Holliday junction resolvase RuvX [Lewinella sp. IMCC34183]